MKVRARERKKAADAGEAMDTDDKIEEKKEGDVEMKDEAPVEETGKKRKEPSFETITNFSRVTPQQTAYVVVPQASRYQPVRPLSTRVTVARGGKGALSKAEKYSGGGGIIMLRDSQPGAEAEYIELFVPPPAPEPAAAAPASGEAPPALLHIALDESSPDAEPPQSFEVCLPSYSVSGMCLFGAIVSVRRGCVEDSGSVKCTVAPNTSPLCSDEEESSRESQRRAFTATCRDGFRCNARQVEIGRPAALFSLLIFSPNHHHV